MSAASPPPPCPFCNEPTHVSQVSQFAGQIITSQWRCHACNSYYEAIRADYDPRP